MPERDDLATLVRNLTPGALRLFKQQIAALPERDKQAAFSRLSGIVELEDITGRPTPRPAQKPEEVPLWARGLQTLGAPFEWVSRNITEPFGAVALSGFTPGLPGGRRPTESALAYARRQYEQWEEPTWTMPWGGQFRPTKGIVETLPWFALPTAGGIVGKLGGLTAKGGALGKAAGYGAAALKPVAVAEQVLNPLAWQRGISRLAAKRAGGGRLVPKEVTPVTPEVAKFAPEYVEFLESIRGTTSVDFTIKKVTGAGLANWRAIDRATGIDIGGGNSRKLAQNVVNRVVVNKAKLVEPSLPKAVPEKVTPTASEVAKYRWEVTESNGNTFISNTPVEVGQKTSGSLYATKVEKVSAEQVKPIIGIGGEKVGERIVSKAEALPGKVIGKVAGKVLPKKVTPVTPEDIVGSGEYIVRGTGASVEKLGVPAREVPGGVGGTWATRDLEYAREYGEPIGFLRTPSRILRVGEGTTVPGFDFGKASWKEIKDFAISKNYDAIEFLPGVLSTKNEIWIFKRPKLMKLEEIAITKAGLGKIIPKVGRVPTKILSEMFPAGLPEEQATATKWLTDLTRKSKPLTKETLELRKPEHAARSAQYEKLLQEKIAKGVPVKQAEEEATQQALYGVYSKAPLTPAFVEQLKEQGKYEATLLRMIADANFKYGFERKNAFSAFWDLLNEGHLQMNQIQTLERVFGSELAKALLEKNRTLGQKIWFNVVDAVNIPRGLLSMADMSGFGRQGWILTTTRPDRAIKAVMPMIESMFSEKNAMFLDDIFLNRKHIDKVLRLRPDFLTKWAGEATDIVAREEGFASRWLNKFPVVGQIYKGSTRAYTTVLNDLRTANVSAAISGWEKNGFKYLDLDEAAKLYGSNAKAIFDAKFYTDVDIDMVARTVSWASGRGSLPKELARHAGIANAMFFAPKLIASRIEFPFAVLPGVNPSRLARREAAREMLSFIGTSGGILAMATLAGQGEVELDPRSPDFGKLKVEDTRLDIWTGYAQYLRFIAQMATAQGKTQSGRITTKGRGELIGRFAQSKLSPAAGFITDLVRGETYLGEDMPPMSRKSIQGQIYNRMMPLAIQDMVDGYLEDSWSGGLVSSLGFYGVGIVTYTDEVKRARDKVAQEEFGMSWGEVGTKYGRAAQLKLEQTPTIIEAEKEHEDRFAGGTLTSMDNFRNEGKLIEETYRKDVDNAVREFRATKNGKLFKDKINKVSDDRRSAYSLRAKKDEYQDIIAYYNQPLPPDKLAEMNPGDVLRREFYQQMFDPIKMEDEFGNYRFDEADKIEREFVVKYGQQAMDYIEEYQGARWQDKPVELKMLEEAKELLRPYWDIPDKVWAMYPEGLREISDRIQVGENGTDEQQRMAKMELRKYPMILRAWELIVRYKQQMRRYNPAINQAHKMFY